MPPTIITVCTSEFYMVLIVILPSLFIIITVRNIVTKLFDL